MFMTFDRYKTLSLIDIKPIIFYDQDSQKWLCYWFGLLITAEMAMIYCAFIFWNNPCGSDVKTRVLAGFKEILQSPLAEYVDPEFHKHDPWFYTKHYLAPRIEQCKVLTSYTNEEVYTWFVDMLTGNIDGN